MKNLKDCENLPYVSIIILNFNGRHYLRKCLSSIAKLNYPKSKYEVILVDNASTDGSVEFVKRNFPWVKIISLNKNYGFCGGNNRGAKIARGDYLAFLNNDTKVSKTWLIELVKASIMYSAPICGSKTLFMEKPSIIEYGGAKLTIIGRGYSISLGLKDSSEHCKLVGYPCAAAMLIKKDVYEELGGFDEKYFACLDDTDLGWRAWLRGYKVLYVPTSIVYHFGGGTTGKGRVSPLKAFHGTKNAIMNILKNLELRNLVLGLALAIIYDIVEIILLMRHKNMLCVKMKMKAYLWILSNLSFILQKRRIVQKNRLISDKWLYTKGLMATFKEAVREYLRLGKLLPIGS